MFTSYHSLLIKSEVHPSLHPHWHHQIRHAKLDLKIHYPPSLWTWANVDHIRKNTKKSQNSYKMKHINFIEIYEIYKNDIFEIFKCPRNELSSVFESNKQKCYFRLSYKLVNPMTNTKSYWSTLKLFLNKKKNPCIPL